jgi:hypothetical protein
MTTKPYHPGISQAHQAQGTILCAAKTQEVSAPFIIEIPPLVQLAGPNP